MSLKKLLLASTSVIIFSACCGFFFLSNAESNTPTAIRVPTSDFSGYGPADRTFNIKIKDSGAAKNENEVVIVKTDVSLPFDFDQAAEYTWILADGVHLTEGDLSGKLVDFKAQAKKAVQIAVTGFTEKENRQIVFRIFAEKNGRRIFADGIISSQKENTFEDIVQNVEKIKQQQKEEH